MLPVPKQTDSNDDDQPSTSQKARQRVEQSADPRLISQKELDELVSDFKLSKERAVLLYEGFKERNLLQPGVHVTKFD